MKKALAIVFFLRFCCRLGSWELLPGTWASIRSSTSSCLGPHPNPSTLSRFQFLPTPGFLTIIIIIIIIIMIIVIIIIVIIIIIIIVIIIVIIIIIV